MELKDHIRSIPDFPKPGILFYDISTLLSNADAWQVALTRLTRCVSKHHPDFLLGIESRGFLLAAPLAARLGVGFAMVRKKGKLPGEVASHEYKLEYGSDVIEIQADAIKNEQRIVILDDLLATGGTAECVSNMLLSLDKIVLGLSVVIELSDLNGKGKFNFPVVSQICY